MEVHVLHRQGKKIRAIARETGFSRNTVRAILRGKHNGQYGPRRRSTSKLDPFKEFLRARVGQAGAIRLPATVLHREISEHGFEGSVKIVQRFLNSIRPVIELPPVVRFETEPGHQLQIDFVVLRRGPLPLRAFTAELGYSRYPTSSLPPTSVPKRSSPASNARFTGLAAFRCTCCAITPRRSCCNAMLTRRASTATMASCSISPSTTALKSASARHIALRPREKSSASTGTSGNRSSIHYSRSTPTR